VVNRNPLHPDGLRLSFGGGIKAIGTIRKIDQKARILAMVGQAPGSALRKIAWMPNLSRSFESVC